MPKRAVEQHILDGLQECILQKTAPLTCANLVATYPHLIVGFLGKRTGYHSWVGPQSSKPLPSIAWRILQFYWCILWKKKGFWIPKFLISWRLRDVCPNCWFITFNYSRTPAIPKMGKYLQGSTVQLCRGGDLQTAVWRTADFTQPKCNPAMCRRVWEFPLKKASASNSVTGLLISTT